MQSNLNRWFVGFASVAIIGQVSAAGTLTGVTAQKQGNGVLLQISGENLSKPRTFLVNGQKSYLLEFDAKLIGRAKTFQVDSDGIDYVKYGWYKARPAKVRIHVRLDQPQQLMLAQRDGNWVVATGSAPKPAATAAKFPDKLPPLRMLLKPRTAVASTTEETPNPILTAQKSQTPKSVPPIETAKAASPKTSLMARPVTLDFVNTDVVQILKALALQAGVNIVTGPEVKGTLTVSLNRVSVTDSLDFVTTMAGLRYANVNGTFVVTDRERLSNAVSQITGNVNQETRIIRLKSGEGLSIKATVLKAIPQASAWGSYEIVLPSEELSVQSGSSTGVLIGPGPSSDPTKTTGNDPHTDIASKATSGPDAKKDMYLTLIGPKQRLDEVETLIHELDGKIITAAGLGLTTDMETRVVPIYSSQMTRIREALSNLLMKDPRKDSYQVSESLGMGGQSDVSVNLLMISGPKDSLDNLETFAKTMDRSIADVTGVSVPSNAEEAQRMYEVVNLTFVEPFEAANELQTMVRGLRASIMPQSVDPLVLGPSDKGNANWTKQPSTGSKTSESGAATGQETGGQTSQTSGEAKAGEQKAAETQTSANAKGIKMTKALGTEPMKLLLYGTRSQIAEAHKMLALIDIAPKQVALELRIMELSKSEAERFGLDWGILTGGLLQAIRVNQGTGDTISKAGNIQTEIGLSRSGKASILATLDSISDKNHLIARPNILANDGRPTQIFVGDEVRYVESIQSTQNGTTVTTNMVNVGMNFQVTPRVGNNGNITLEMNPELSFLRGFDPIPGGGQLPQTSKRTAHSIVSMKSGETLAIGGLIQDQDRKIFSGVPILKDLPIIGKFFSRTTKTKDRSEVVFFITAKEVTPDNRGDAANPHSNDPQK